MAHRTNQTFLPIWKGYISLQWFYLVSAKGFLILSGIHMIDTSDFIQLPYTHDLTEGGIAHMLRSLPYNLQREGSSTYERLRRGVAEAAVEIAFRRYLSEQGIPFDVKAGLPFTGHDHYDVMLGGRRCEIKSLLIRQDQQISQIRQNPKLLLK